MYDLDYDTASARAVETEWHGRIIRVAELKQGKLTSAQATDLTTDANRIRAVLGC